MALPERSTARRRVLVAGATGTLGREVIGELKQRGHWVRALVRRPDALSRPVDEVAVGDLEIPASLQGVCRGVDVVFSAAGASLALRPAPRSSTYHAVDYAGNGNLLHEALQAGADRFVYVSVHHVPATAGLAYDRAHADFEDALRRAGIDHVILQPTGYFSAFRVLPRIARLGVAPLIGSGEALTNPIHEQDLAAVCADAVEQGQGERPIGGPEVLTRRQILELAFEAAGRTPRLIRLPDRLLDFNRWMLSGIDPRLADLLAFFKTVNQVDVVAPQAGSRRLGDYLAGAAA